MRAFSAQPFRAEDEKIKNNTVITYFPPSRIFQVLILITYGKKSTVLENTCVFLARLLKHSIMPKCRQQKFSTGISEIYGRTLINYIDKNK